MDSQSALWSAAGLAALVHGAGARRGRRTIATPGRSREVLMEASFTAARDGLRARLPMDGALRPGARGRARGARARAPARRASWARATRWRASSGSSREGNGADRQRAAHARGGMAALLDLLVAEAEEPYG